MTSHPTDDGTERPNNLELRDRASIARYLVENEARIRAVARRKLSAATRSVFDSQDIFSSVLRRVDSMVSSGSLRPRSEAELWALIDTITKNNAINRTKMIERARVLLGEESDYVYAQALLDRLNRYSTDDEATLLIYRMMSCLDGEQDRQILLLRLRGATHNAIAVFLKIKEDACRKRWQTIRAALQLQFSEGALDG